MKINKVKLVVRQIRNTNMSITFKKILLLEVFLLTYSLLFYFLVTSQLRLDFYSFYSSAIAYATDINPYQCLQTTYFVIQQNLPANLNPPIFLQLLRPLTQLNYQQAPALWFIISFFLGSIGALLSFKILCSRDFFKKNWLILLFIYLGMHSTLMSMGIGQLGSILLFFIISGYYFYLREQDYLAGILWGFIISIKLFPALLFIFALNQKRFKLFLIMLVTCSMAWVFPFLIKGIGIYSLYFKMLPRVLWFGDNWNASLYGFLFRLFIDVKSAQNVWVIKITYLFFFIILLIWYIKKIILFKKTNKDHRTSDHRAFCLTLVMMLLMSPLGWLYYFSLLIMPLTLIWQSLDRDVFASTKAPVLWALSLFLINFPVGYIETPNMNHVIYKLSVYSFHFYGLVLVAYLIGSLREPLSAVMISTQEKNKNHLYPLYLALALGIFIILSCFIMQLI